MTKQLDYSTITELPEHISRHLETLVRGIEAIQQKNYRNLPLYGAVGIYQGIVPQEGTFTEIRSALVEVVKRYDEQKSAKFEGLEKQEKKVRLALLNDWVMKYECGDKDQKFTHPAHCLGYILRLFPEMEKKIAWRLAQAESKKRNAIWKEFHWEPSDEDEADYQAMAVVDKTIPDWRDWEDIPLNPRNRQEFIRGILWDKRYDEAYRSVLRTTLRLAILTVCYRGIPVRREGRVHSSSGKSASTHRQKDDSGGGDGDSDGPGDPPGPRLVLPSHNFHVAIQLNSLPRSRTPHPCRWSLDWRCC